MAEEWKSAPTRRAFLGIPEKREIAGLLSATRTGRSQTGPLSDPAPGAGKVWVTDEHRKISPAGAVEWTEARAGISPATIVLHPEERHQEILGFGVGLSEASCFLLNRLASPARAELVQTLFGPSEMGLSVCRTSIGSSNSATRFYSYDDGEVDPDLKRFSIDPDRNDILPILRQARGTNPDLFLLSSPWSPPGWMKSSGSLLGGCMRHTYMPSYANYFLKFLRAYEAEGVPVQAVTVQNAVDSDQDGAGPACAWPQDYEADFVTMHLGPLFERIGLKTKIWIIDHNYNLWGRAMGELETPDVLRYTNAVAWHGTQGKPEWIRRVQDAFPGVEMHWTESGPDLQAAEDAAPWASWGKTFTEVLRNCCRSIITANLATDERGGPRALGPATGAGGALIIDSQTQKISYRGIFWALGHFSRFVRRGAIRIDSQSVQQEFHHCVFQNPDGSLVAVIANPGPERSCEMRLAGKGAALVLAKNSLTTLVFSRPGGR